MSRHPLDHIIESAIAEGILPAGTVAPAAEHRPWPVLVLTALGSWLVAVPLVMIMFTLFGATFDKGPVPYIVGLLLLGACVAALRKEDLPLFVEQLTVPGLLVAGCYLAFGLFRDFEENLAAAILAVLACGVAFAVPRNWVRVLLGVAACGLTIKALSPSYGYSSKSLGFWVGLHGAVMLWLAGQWAQRRAQPAIFERLGQGWAAASLAGLAMWSGMTFLAGASLGAPHSPDAAGPVYTGAVSLMLAGAAAGWLAFRWPSLRQPWSALAAVVVLGLAWLMPSLGAALLILAICATERYWKLAGAAGLAAAWIVGAFYYQLTYPLVTKAVLMIGAGGLLGAIAWTALRGTPIAPTREAAPALPQKAGLGIVLCTVSVLAVANIGIWQKENLIAEGRPVFVELAPVDPRSLMQGDYMRLGFRLPPEVQMFDRRRMPGGRRLHAVGTVDARGIATLNRTSEGSAHGPSEIVVELTPKDGRWMLVTDAWHFKEGEAERWARAKYGEFRVTPDGRALLVGLRGPALEAL